MASTDGSVNIAIEMNVDDAERELASLKKQIVNLEKDTGLKKFLHESLVEQVNEAGANLDSAKKKLDEMQSDELGTYSKKDIAEQEEHVKLLQREYDKLAGEEERITTEIERGNLELEYTKQRYGEVAAEAEKLKAAQEAETEEPKAQPEADIDEDTGIDEEATESKLDRIKQKFFEFGSNVKSVLSKTFSSAIGAIGNGLKKIPGLLKSAFSKGIQFVKTFGKNVLNAAKHLNVFSAISKKLGPALGRLGSMLRQAFVFGVLTKGLNYVREQMGNLLSTNTEFMAALNRLKGVLMTAFQPIYDYIMPALTSLINIITRAMAVVAQFIAALFGKTAKQSQKNAEALNQESKALSGTGEAADEAAGSLAGFDEINTIQTEDKKSGGGGGGTKNEEPLFDYEYNEIEGELPFDSWGAAFDAFLQKMLDGIPQLQNALNTAAGNLNSFTKKLLDMFTFPGVKDKVSALGTELAESFNGLVDNINWYQMGQALGAGLDLALAFLVNFLYTFNWQNLGASLASGLNGIVSKIDWNAAGQLLWSGYKIALETLAGFLLNLNMPELADAASKLMIGFFDSATDTLDRINWAGLGQQITSFITEIDWAGVAESASKLVREFFQSITEFIANIDWFAIGEEVKEFLVNIDWAGIVRDLFTAIGAAFGAAAEFLWGLIHEAWDSIVNWWHENAYEDGEFTLQGLLDGMWEKIKDIGKWIKENIFQPFIDGFKKVFGISSPSTVMKEQGNFIMDGLFGGISEKLKPILNFFNNDFFNGIKQSLSGVINFIKGVFTGDWRKAWDGIKDIFKGVWNGIVGFLEGAVNIVIRGINWLISKINTISFDVPDWVPKVGGKTIGFNIPSINEVTLPRLAQGAVIPPNREFMAVLGDQKSGTNIEAPEDTIRKIVREETGGGVEILQEILQAIKAGQVIQVDGTTFGRTAIRSINNVTHAAGKQLLSI